ncbi:hypothetical protein CLHUN_02070 [Ruminiclostridium hungatei]|uniref:Uncharacterized protein n=1 Tax=Ruminiclostridium hungatei TaxID=48256 RepID=A0A1V4SSW5_RUMHU|nr:hypothetical protein [Ruminiclostridium hungatei]OPX46391.1 hypothetical protein CLHUN_02070 [Ruminiclostridium hungatei]
MIDPVLGTILAVAVTVERLVELVKPLFLMVKSSLTKKKFTELTGSEKIAITILIGPLLVLTAGFLGVQEVSPLSGVPPAAQQILIGLLASFGSNVIHPVIGLVVAFKDAAKGLKDKNIWD